MTTAGLAGRPGGVRRLGRAVRGAALSGACLAGVAAVGAVVSSRATYPRPRQDAPGRPAAPPAPAGRIVVAVVLGPRGSVGTDALGPMRSSPGHRHSSCTRCPRAGRPACSPAAWPWYRSTRWRTWTPAWCPSRTWSWCRPLSTRPARSWRRCATGSPAARAGELTSSASAPGRCCWPPLACLTAAGPPRTGRTSPACAASTRRWNGCGASVTSSTARSPPRAG